MMVSNPDLTQPWGQWEIVDVTFNSSANVDTAVPHSLSPQVDEQIYYTPLRKAQAADVYHNIAGTRKPWGAGFILLRSNVASAKVTLLLTVGHSKRTFAF